MKARDEVLKVMQDAGKPITPREIAEALGKKPGTVRVMMIALREAGEVKPSGSYGLWTLAKTNASGKQKLTVDRDAEGKKTNASPRKKLTGKTNALPNASQQDPKPELSDKEKARIVYNLMQNKRHAVPEVRARRREQNKKWRDAHPDKARQSTKRWRKNHPGEVEASRIRQYAKRYAELIGEAKQ
jgi:hypothetical protein